MSSQDQTVPHRVVSQEEWLAARKAHLKNEKALTRLRDLVAAERRALPWVKIDKEYVFETAEGRVLHGEAVPGERVLGPGGGHLLEDGKALAAHRASTTPI